MSSCAIPSLAVHRILYIPLYLDLALRFFFFFLILSQPISTLFPYTTLFRSILFAGCRRNNRRMIFFGMPGYSSTPKNTWSRSEEHTSESSHRCISYAVFCLKKKNIRQAATPAHERGSLPARQRTVHGIRVEH